MGGNSGGGSGGSGSQIDLSAIPNPMGRRAAGGGMSLGMGNMLGDTPEKKAKPKKKRTEAEKAERAKKKAEKKAKENAQQNGDQFGTMPDSPDTTSTATNSESVVFPRRQNSAAAGRRSRGMASDSFDPLGIGDSGVDKAPKPSSGSPVCFSHGIGLHIFVDSGGQSSGGFDAKNDFGFDDEDLEALRCNMQQERILF